MLRRPVLISLLCAALTASAASDALTGDWQVNGGGAVLRVAAPADEGAAMNIVWLDGPDWSIAPGTVIGTATPGSAPGVYDLRLDVDPDGRSRTRTATFAVRMTDADTLDFEAYSHRTGISLWRWVPYLFRVTIVRNKQQPHGLDGARRVGAAPQYIVL